MNVEWWGGEQSSPPCRLQVGAPIQLRCQRNLFGQWMAFGAFYAASGTLALPGSRRSQGGLVYGDGVGGGGGGAVVVGYG